MKLVYAPFALLLLILMQVCAMEPAEPNNAPATGEYVILLHGLLRTGRSMDRLEKSLAGQGYNVINMVYPSTKQPVERLAEENLGPVIARCGQAPGVEKIHFVTHSTGGIIVRYYLKHHELPTLGRVVMLSPPNQGVELVDRFKDNFLFRALNGPAGLQMGTEPHSIPLKLGPVDFELGVITGNRSLNPIASLLIPGPDDGVIAVERTKVAGMSDFLLMPTTHTFIMRRKGVIEQVLHFLKHGAFKTAAEH